MITAWQDDRRMTDSDHGITAADTADEWAGHAVKTDVRPMLVGWRWEVYQVDGPDEWEVDGGWEHTKAEAEAAGEKAKAEFIRTLLTEGAK